MKAIKVIFRTMVILIVLVAVYFFVSTTEFSRKRITAVIMRKHPTYEIVTLTPEYSDWSSTVCEADDDHNPEFAKVVIQNDEEQRTICLDKTFGIWVITSDEPDYGKNVPDDVYFVEERWANVGKAIDIEAYVRSVWVVPFENGELYRKYGGDNWYYSYKYIENLYRTINGSVYVLNKESFEWEQSDLAYSYMVQYANYKKISKDEGEGIISKYSNYGEDKRG